MKPRTIIIVNDAAHITGGAGKVALQSAIGLARKGYHVVLFTAIGPVDEKLIEAGIEVVCLEQHDILSDPNRLRAIRQGIWNRRAAQAFSALLDCCSPNDTVIHFHAWIKALSPSLFSVTAQRPFQVLITLHDFFTCCPNGGFYNYQSQTICERKAMSCKCIFCNCDVRSYPQKVWRCLRQLVQSHIFSKNSNFSFISISKLSKDITFPYLKRYSTSWFYVANPVELNEKETVDIMGNDVYLFIARLSAEKGVDLFCQAITELHLKGIVLGDGYLRKDLEKKYSSIRFIGWVDGKNKEKYIRQAKGLIMSSRWYETFGLVVAEMKSYGIPCIVPDRCAASEQVLDGKTGYVFESGNLQSLKDCILKYEHTDLFAMQQCIRKDFSSQEYSVKTHVEKLVEVYSKILKK